MSSFESSFSQYSQTFEENYEREREQRKERLNQRQIAHNIQREQHFQSLFESDLPILVAPGIKFLAFRHLKIKFSFTPSILSQYVSNKIIYYVSLRYITGYWRVKRDSIPLHYKSKIYKLFYGEDFFSVDDSNIIEAINRIYSLLKKCTKQAAARRLEKFERYKKGEDVTLYTDDEEILLTEEERNERFAKRIKILRRMIPPDWRSRRS